MSPVAHEQRTTLEATSTISTRQAIREHASDDTASTVRVGAVLTADTVKENRVG